MHGTRADLARITAALDADPFAAFVFAGNEPVCRADARRIERELIAKFSPAPRGSQAGSAQPRAGHTLPEGARAPNREALSGFSDLRFHEAI